MIIRRSACLAMALRSVAAAFLPTTTTTRNALCVRNGGRLRLSTSSFQPPAPPGTHGTPVFPNIDFTVSQSSASEAFRRNNDPQAVFVVTGANRGIGLQFVKSLMDRTKVKIHVRKTHQQPHGLFVATELTLFLYANMKRGNS
jgi:hypothetical protein